jgi:hypothetical protein
VIRILSDIPCSGSSSQADPWVPLTVSWQVSSHGAPMNLYVRGEDGGYVELKVDPETFALQRLVVVDVPPTSERIIERSTGIRESAPVLDCNLWEWKTTPDYTEPMRRDADTTAPLSLSRDGESVALWFSNDEAARFLSCENVIVGVSGDAAMVCVIVPPPAIDEPIGYPRTSQ